MDSKQPNSDFVKLERELEKTLLKLKRATDPNLRRELLRYMRLLLREADQILDTSTPP